MKEAKKKEDFFTRHLGEIYNISNMLQQEGRSSAECRYREIVATIMLVIRDDLHAIRLTKRWINWKTWQGGIRNDFG